MTYGKSIFVLGLGFLMLPLASVLIAVPPRNTAQADVAGGSSVWIRRRLVNEISGTIEVNTTWTVDDSPYVVTGDLAVSEGVTLTIEPDVEVRFAITDALSSGEDQEKVELIVAGTLIADEVTFTSNADLPAGGDWYGIKFLDSSMDWDGSGGSIITNSTIEYGILGVSTQDASPMISHNIIRTMKGKKGLDCSGSDTYAGDSYGVYVSGGSSPPIQDNEISDISGGEGGDCSSWDYDSVHTYGGDGYAIYAAEGSSPIIQDNAVSHISGGRGGDCASFNHTYAGDGYGIYVQGGSSFLIQGNTISHVDGGQGGFPSSDCYSHGGNSYGIYIQRSFTPTISGNDISDVSGGSGGVVGFGPGVGRTGGGGHAVGVYGEASSLEITENTITDINGGSSSGGAIGIYLANSETTVDSNSVSSVVDGAPIPGSDGAFGVGIWIDDGSSSVLVNNTISNIIGGDGGDGFCVGSVCHYGNAGAGDGGTGTGVYASDGSFANVVNNTIFDVYGGDGGSGSRSWPFVFGLGGAGSTAVGIHVMDSTVILNNDTIVSGHGGAGGESVEGSWVRHVRASTDDAREFANGDYDDDGPSVLLGDENGLQDYVGFRFEYVEIPQPIFRTLPDE